MPGSPAAIVNRKKVFQPSASTTKPQIGPAAIREIPNRLENKAYWVAEKRFWVRRKSRTKNAPVPSAAGERLEPDRAVHQRQVHPSLCEEHVTQVRGRSGADRRSKAPGPTRSHR